MRGAGAGAILASLAALTLGSVTPAYARVDEPQPKRPKVALVLSGGGALGLAHVGVIQALEDAGIRPDLIVGTSMGAVVGGAYASGYAAKDLRRITDELDWNEIFNARPSRSDISYRKKRDQQTFPVKFSVKIDRSSVSLPSAVIGDQRLMAALSGIVAGRDLAVSFDQLPIPFRAVTTDIETGTPVVLDHGNLATAMRASMAVPGVFAPEPIDGDLLVDGGLSNNIPVDVALALGADVIIVSEMQTRLRPQEKIRSALETAGQALTLLILLNERQQLASLRPQDILISVDTNGFSAANFDRSADLVALGLATARAQGDRLKELASPSDRPAYPSPRAPPVLDFVQVENGSRLADRLVAAPFESLIGSPLDARRLEQALSRTYALGAFERVDYALSQTEKGTGLAVRARSSANRAADLRFGLTLDNDFEGGGNYRLSVDYRTPALDTRGSEVRLEAVFGDRLRLAGEYYRLLDDQQRWFVAPRINLASSNVALYGDNGFKTGEYRATYREAQLDIGRQLGSSGEIRLGLQAGTGKAKVREGQAPQDEVPIRIGQAVSSFGIDTLDDALFPRTGISLSGRWIYGRRDLGAKDDFQTLDGTALLATSKGRSTLVLQAEGGRGIQGVQPIESLYRAGGFLSLSGYRTGELTGEAYAISKLIYRYKLNSAEPLFFGVPVFAGASMELGNAWERVNDARFSDLKFGASIYLAADTIMGPLYLAYGQSGRDRSSVYLFIGRPF